MPPYYNIGLNFQPNEWEESLEMEPEEDPMEDPEEEKPIASLDPSQVPTSEPNSPVFIEISSDSSMSLERNDSPAPVETEIPMPQLPEHDLFPPTPDPLQPPQDSEAEARVNLNRYWESPPASSLRSGSYRAYWDNCWGQHLTSL